MGRRARPARVDDRVALRQPDVVEVAAAQGALVVSDRHAAVERVDQATVPKRHVRRRGRVAGRGQGRDRVDEAVDRAALTPHDVGHRSSVQRSRHRHVGGQRACRKRPELTGRVPVLEVDHGIDRAVLAPADQRRGGIARRLEEPHAGAHLVVDVRESEALRLGLADEGLLLRSREDRPRDRMIHERQLGLRPPVPALPRLTLTAMRVFAPRRRPVTMPVRVRGARRARASM